MDPVPMCGDPYFQCTESCPHCHGIRQPPVISLVSSEPQEESEPREDTSGSSETEPSERSETPEPGHDYDCPGNCSEDQKTASQDDVMDTDESEDEDHDESSDEREEATDPTDDGGIPLPVGPLGDPGSDSDTTVEGPAFRYPGECSRNPTRPPPTTHDGPRILKTRETARKRVPIISPPVIRLGVCLGPDRRKTKRTARKRVPIPLPRTPVHAPRVVHHPPSLPPAATTLVADAVALLKAAVPPRRYTGVGLAPVMAPLPVPPSAPSAVPSPIFTFPPFTTPTPPTAVPASTRVPASPPFQLPPGFLERRSDPAPSRPPVPIIRRDQTTSSGRPSWVIHLQRWGREASYPPVFQLGQREYELPTMADRATPLIVDQVVRIDHSVDDLRREIQGARQETAAATARFRDTTHEVQHLTEELVEAHQEISSLRARVTAQDTIIAEVRSALAEICEERRQPPQ